VLGDGGQIITQNFDTYPVMRMQSVPQIEVLLIESGEPPTGVGEVSVPTAAPALTNAIFALTGTRIRRRPSPRPSGLLRKETSHARGDDHPQAEQQLTLDAPADGSSRHWPGFELISPHGPRAPFLPTCSAALSHVTKMKLKFHFYQSL
jgi:hypothetical protein